MKIKLLKIILISLACFFIVALVRDFLVTNIASIITTQITGAKTQIRWVSLGLLRQSLIIHGLKMYNPKGFQREIFLDVPKLSGSLNLFSLLRGKLHLRLVEMDLKEIILEKNKEGNLNVDI